MNSQWTGYAQAYIGSLGLSQQSCGERLAFQLTAEPDETSENTTVLYVFLIIGLTKQKFQIRTSFLIICNWDWIIKNITNVNAAKLP